MPFRAVTPAQATEADSPHPGARRETEAHSGASAAPRTPTRVVEKEAGRGPLEATARCPVVRRAPGPAHLR